MGRLAQTLGLTSSQDLTTTGSNSLINIGELSKPATVLIEKVCNAVGVLYEPTRIRRQAHAEADATKINALARMELTNLEERAFERLAHQEARKQENIEQITIEAASQVKTDAKPENMDPDWIAHFFKQCDTVSDKEMQSLWSKLLSGEATKPGTFSKRTINLIASLDKRDAALFTLLGQFIWMLGSPMAIIIDPNDPLLVAAGITFTDLKHLDSIGLINFEQITTFQVNGLPKFASASYCEKLVMLEFPNDTDNTVVLGNVLLTKTGQELFPICGSVRNLHHFEAVVAKWKAVGIKVTVPDYIFR